MEEEEFSRALKDLLIQKSQNSLSDPSSILISPAQVISALSHDFPIVSNHEILGLNAFLKERIDNGKIM